MTLKRRLERLEAQAQAENEILCALYDAKGNEVQSDIITMPEHEVEGLAELPDGKQIPVVFDAYAIKLGPPPGEDEPPLDENKLYYRYRPGVEIQYREGMSINLYLPDGIDVDTLL